MTQIIEFLCLLFLVTANAEYHYNTKWITVPLDHYNFQNKQTFKMKYLENDDHWDRNGGPIFFYTGNEGPIEMFAKATGFMWEIASEFKAKIVFAEHRFYGASIPASPTVGSPHVDSGDYSSSTQALTDFASFLDYVEGKPKIYHNSIPSPDTLLGYLSITQALADFANLLDSMEGGTKYPVITFGGSYGGMLSAYIRMKYPHIVAGAIAASAPIIMFNEKLPCDTLPKSVTATYALANANCSINIRNSWDVIANFTKDANNYDWLTTNWRLCDPIESEVDVKGIQIFLMSLYSLLAMVNYPYPSDYLKPLPAYPVRTVCQYLSEQLTGQPLLEAISKVLDVYTNFDKNKCVQHSRPPFGDDFTTVDSWEYQCCTEMPQIQCPTGVNDMFRPWPFNQTADFEYCHDIYGVKPNYNWTEVEFGGERLQAASNIVFSNGLLDPWAGYGILKNVSETVQVVIMNDTAHHLDLMASNAADPPSVRVARQFHKVNIRKWIKNFQRVQTENYSNSG